MKKYPKIVQSDSRGQIVIPKDVRRELGIEEGTGFYMYTISEEGILLKKIDLKDLGEHTGLVDELMQNAQKIGLDKGNLKRSVKAYRKTRAGGLEVL